MTLMFLSLFLVFLQPTWAAKDFDPRKLLINYGDCLSIHEEQTRGHGPGSRYEYISNCIDGLKTVHGQITPLDTIRNVLKSPLNPVDNRNFFESCVIEYPRGQVTLTTLDFMEDFVEKVQTLIDNHSKLDSYQSLACFELNLAHKFMCDVQEKCAQTEEERKQVELVYVVGYSLFQLVMGSNQKLNCSTEPNGIWLGQLDTSVWSSTEFDVDSRLFEAKEPVCPSQKSKQNKETSNFRQMYFSYRKLLSLMTKL